MTPEKIKVLFAEDEYLVASMVCDTILERGLQVLGPVATLRGALNLIKCEKPDIAILDFMVSGVRAFPLCQELDRMGVPFGFASAVTEGNRGIWGNNPSILKPYSEPELIDLIDTLLSMIRIPIIRKSGRRDNPHKRLRRL